MPEIQKTRPCQAECFKRLEASGVKKPKCVFDIVETGSDAQVSSRVSQATQQAGLIGCPKTEIISFRNSHAHRNRSFASPFNTSIRPAQANDPADGYSRDKTILRRQIIADRRG